MQKLTTVVEARIDEVHSLANRVELGKKRNKAYEGIIDELIHQRLPPYMPEIAEAIAFGKEIFSLEWQDVVREASLGLAVKFGPEVAVQSKEMFEKAKDSYAKAARA